MDKELCIVHANCQAPPLVERLLACPAFAERYKCAVFTNYMKQPVPDDMLGRCSLFLHQHLDEKWGDLASEVLLKKLPQSATALCVPNMFFKAYWPMWSGEPGFDFRCAHLEMFIAMDLPPEETVLLFLRSAVEREYDLLEMVSETIEVERKREVQTPVKYLDVIVEHYRDERLFNTINHPNARLMNHAAVGVLEQLGFDAPDAAALATFGEPFPEFEQPINPRVGAFFGWDFAGPDAQYNIYGRKMSFARYAANYVMARKSGVADFIGYLQGDYIEI